jgi:hypothetical protein
MGILWHYPFGGEFSKLRRPCSCGVSRDQGDARAALPYQVAYAFFRGLS